MAALGRRPYPVRWYYSGYRDGYSQTYRLPLYFDNALPPEHRAYMDGFKKGNEQRRREQRHQLTMAQAVASDCC